MKLIGEQFPEVLNKASDARILSLEYALEQLLLAFAKGEESGSVEWEDVELAFALAKDALPGSYERILQLKDE